jgi:hypothetical protein
MFADIQDMTFANTGILPMTFPERKAALRHAGIPQAEIARRTGFSTVYVHEVMRGTRTNRTIQEAVARAIGRSLHETFPEGPQD